MFPARGGMDEIEITLTVSGLTMLSNCAAWSMIDRLATLKNSAKLRGLGGWRYEPRQVRGAGDSAKLPVHTETMDFGDWEYPEADWGRPGRAANQGL